MECPAMRKLKHGSVHPKGSRGRAESPLVAAAAAILPAPIKVKKQECALRRGGGASAKPPRRSRRSEIPAFRKRAAMSERPATRSRPFGATMCRRLVERLRGRVCGRAKLLAGTLRCLRLCWRFPWNWSPEKQLGRCPKPHKGRCPLTLQGADEKGRSPPLDPFRAIELSSLSYFFRVLVPFSPSLP